MAQSLKLAIFLLTVGFLQAMLSLLPSLHSQASLKTACAGPSVPLQLLCSLPLRTWHSSALSSPCVSMHPIFLTPLLEILFDFQGLLRVPLKCSLLTYSQSTQRTTTWIPTISEVRSLAQVLLSNRFLNIFTWKSLNVPQTPTHHLPSWKPALLLVLFPCSPCCPAILDTLLNSYPISCQVLLSLPLHCRANPASLDVGCSLLLSLLTYNHIACIPPIYPSHGLECSTLLIACLTPFKN